MTMNVFKSMCWTHESQSLNLPTNKRLYGIDYRIHLNEFSVSKSFYWKQCKWDQQKFILIFLLKLCLLFCLICFLKILNRKATVSKETMRFDVWMATILSYMKPRFTKRITITGYSIPEVLRRLFLIEGATFFKKGHL